MGEAVKTASHDGRASSAPVFEVVPSEHVGSTTRRGVSDSHPPQFPVSRGNVHEWSASTRAFEAPPQLQDPFERWDGDNLLFRWGNVLRSMAVDREKLAEKAKQDAELVLQRLPYLAVILAGWAAASCFTAPATAMWALATAIASFLGKAAVSVGINLLRFNVIVQLKQWYRRAWDAKSPEDIDAAKAEFLDLVVAVLTLRVSSKAEEAARLRVPNHLPGGLSVPGTSQSTALTSRLPHSWLPTHGSVARPAVVAAPMTVTIDGLEIPALGGGSQGSRGSSSERLDAASTNVPAVIATDWTLGALDQERVAAAQKQGPLAIGMIGDAHWRLVENTKIVKHRVGAKEVEVPVVTTTLLKQKPYRNAADPNDMIVVKGTFKGKIFRDTHPLEATIAGSGPEGARAAALLSQLPTGHPLYLPLPPPSKARARDPFNAQARDRAVAVAGGLRAAEGPPTATQEMATPLEGYLSRLIELDSTGPVRVRHELRDLCRRWSDFCYELDYVESTRAVRIEPDVRGGVVVSIRPPHQANREFFVIPPDHIDEFSEAIRDFTNRYGFEAPTSEAVRRRDAALRASLAPSIHESLNHILEREGAGGGAADALFAILRYAAVPHETIPADSGHMWSIEQHGSSTNGHGLRVSLTVRGNREVFEIPPENLEHFARSMELFAVSYQTWDELRPTWSPDPLEFRD